MALTAEESTKASAIVSEWFWQPAEGHNYRFEHATRTITRYYESAAMQPDEIRLVIEYLRTQDLGQDGVRLLNRSVDFGTGWKAQDAWYQTAATDKWAGSESTKIRIYQVLFKSAGNSGDGPYVVEKGCQYKVSHTFYWDVESLPGVPQAESGIEYALQGVVRNKENGLFSCVLERRERVQQDVAEYVTGETAFETRKDEQHLGVRQANVSRTGKRASVSRGTVVIRKITKNADCTSNVQNETTVDKEVQGAVVEYRKTLRGSVVRTVSRNQTSKLTAAGLEVGETRRSEQTDSQLWNNETQKTTGSGAGMISEACDKSEGVHTDVTVENVAVKPNVSHQTSSVNEVVRKEARRTEENTWDLTTSRIVYTPRSTGQMVHGSSEIVTKTTVGVDQPTVPVTGAGSVNHVLRVSASPNEHGSFSTTVEDTEYVPRLNTYESGARLAKIETKVGKNQLNPIGGAGNVNEDVTISQSINDHGSYDFQQRKIVYTPTVDRFAAGSTNAEVELEVGRNQPSVTASRGSVNEDVSVSVQRNDHDSLDYTVRRIRYAPSSAQVRTDWATDTSTTVVTSNDANKNKSVTYGEASVSLNDHGSATTSVTTIVPKKVDSGWITWSSTTRTRSGTYNHNHGIRIFKNVDNPQSLATGLRGVEVSINASVNRFGKFDGSISYSELVSWTESTGGEVSGITNGTTTLYQFKRDATGRTLKRSVTMSTATFYGRGNEGTEANYKANQKLVSGLSLPSRTYVTDAPSYGNWEAEN